MISPPGSSRSPSRPRILVVDDSRAAVAVIESQLAPVADVLTACSAAEALRVARQQPLDLIISDVVMEGLNGYDLLRFLRADLRLASIPVILITAAEEPDRRAQGLEAGADDYLIKPVRPRELLARASSLIRLRQANQEVERRVLELAALNQSLTQLQGALVQAEKLASLGTLVAGVSHELNNPLAFMKSGTVALPALVDDIRAFVDDPASPSARIGALAALDDITQIAGELGQGVTRLGRISSDLRTSVGAQPEQRTRLGVHAEVQRAWALAVARTGGHSTLAVDIPDAMEVQTIPSLFEEVLLNLFLNAIQAMSGGGEVRLGARVTADEVRLEVADAGPGVPDAHRRRIFDPFFTTRPAGQGTGLGLSVSRGIVTSLGGRIELQSTPSGAGATFALTLPRHPAHEPFEQRRTAAPN